MVAWKKTARNAAFVIVAACLPLSDLLHQTLWRCALLLGAGGLGSLLVFLSGRDGAAGPAMDGAAFALSAWAGSLLDGLGHPGFDIIFGGAWLSAGLLIPDGPAILRGMSIRGLPGDLARASGLALLADSALLAALSLSAGIGGFAFWIASFPVMLAAFAYAARRRSNAMARAAAPVLAGSGDGGYTLRWGRGRSVEGIVIEGEGGLAVVSAHRVSSGSGGMEAFGALEDALAALGYRALLVTDVDDELEDLLRQAGYSGRERGWTRMLRPGRV